MWPVGACSALQDYFSATDWDIFKQATTNNTRTDIEEYTKAVTALQSVSKMSLITNHHHPCYPETMVDRRCPQAPEGPRLSLQGWRHCRASNSQSQAVPWNQGSETTIQQEGNIRTLQQHQRCTEPVTDSTLLILLGGVHQGN